MAMKTGELLPEAPQVFTHEDFGTIRTIIENGEVKFVGKDLAMALGYANPRDALAKHVDDSDKGVSQIATPSGVQQMVVVNESGMYSLIFGSKMKRAKEFKHWVTSVVLPSLRQNGYYVMPNANIPKEALVTPEYLRQIADVLEAKDQQIAALTGENGELKDTVAAQATQIENMKPKACYHDVILACKDTVATTTIAKDYGMSAIKFNKLLHELGVQFKQSGIWYLYQTYAALGWTQTRTANYVKDGEVHAKVYSSWTQTGRFGLYELLKERGYLPKIEQREKTPECVEQQLSF